jgi:hypothetical protein
MNEKTFSTYSVIPTEVILSKDLSSTAKILYGIISSLCNEKGYCWASNEYLGSLIGISKTRTSIIIKELSDYGLIKSCVKDGYKRSITISGGLRKVKGGFKKIEGGGLRKRKDNNINEYYKNNIYKYTFRGNPCRIDNFTGKWKCHENGEWLEITQGYEKEIKKIKV